MSLQCTAILNLDSNMLKKFLFKNMNNIYLAKSVCLDENVAGLFEIIACSWIA